MVHPIADPIIIATLIYVEFINKLYFYSSVTYTPRNSHKVPRKESK